MNPATKIAIITGGGRGIGRSAALNLARAGVDVVITYQSNIAAAEAAVDTIRAGGRKAFAIQLDVGEVSKFEDFASRLVGRLRECWNRSEFDFLINNAGDHRRGRLGEINQSDFDHLCGVHFKGVLFLTQSLLPLLADGGRILNVSSALTRFITPGSSNSIVYASMKGAVEIMTRYMAQELAGRGITVNSLAPGATATNFGGGVLRDNQDVRNVVATHTAFGRVGDAEDIGAAIANLLDDRNRWVTGQRIEASGGMLL
ncbi:SDR family NAD(P)-dependent oxidoreductase [Rhodoblastus sp.]|uniref:SDR family NAD(P)-dependent oxidoreductase n=1 Tax=Rhodoblastus sp. TaxID=1962975 RepID=UPI0035AD7E81